MTRVPVEAAADADADAVPDRITIHKLDTTENNT